MKETYIDLSHKLIFGLIVLATILVPLFFLSTTSEFFETNKFTAFVAITLLALILWAARMVLEQKFTFTKTPVDIPLLVLVAVFFAATLASIDQFTSTIGAHGRPWPGLFALITLVAFYFTAVANLKNRRQVEAVLWTLIGSTTFASLIAIYSYFGSFLPWDFAQIRSFNTLGIINRLALLQSLVLPLSVAAAIFARHTAVKVASTVTTLIMLFSLVLINFWPAYVATAAALLAIAAVSTKTKIDRAAKTTVTILAAFTLIFLIMRFVPQVAQSTLALWSGQEEVDTPKEVTLPQRAGWDIAAQTVGKRPLLGTGPATYRFIFTQLKPRQLNGTNFWSIRFEKASSEITQIIAETGILGVGAFLLLVAVIGRFAFTLVVKSPNPNLYLPLVSALAAFLVSSALAAHSFATVFAFFLVLALISVLAKANDQPHVFDVTVQLSALRDKIGWFPLGGGQGVVQTTTSEKGAKSPVLPNIFLLAVIIVALIGARYQVNAYRAEYHYRQALLASATGNGNLAIGSLQRALAANPHIDTYHRTLAQTTLNAAVNLAAKSDLTDEQKRLLTGLIQTAIDQGKIASGYQILPLRLPGIASANFENWETLAAVYQAMIGSAGGADVHAVNTLSQAVALNPQNPALHDRLGLLYQRLTNLDLAQRKFEDSVIVKPDFGPAHYHLAKVLIERKGEVRRIVDELNAAKRFLPQDDPALSDIENQLKTYGPQLSQPVQQPLASPSPTPSLKSPSPTPSPSPSPSPTPTPTPSPSPGL